MKSEIVDGKLLLRRTAEEKQPFAQRLNRIEGQVRGLRQMIEVDRYCGDEVQQAHAVIAAVREVALLLISQQVGAALGQGSAQAEADALPLVGHADVVDMLRSAYRLQ